jgi:hypothetical protein
MIHPSVPVARPSPFTPFARSSHPTRRSCFGRVAALGDRRGLATGRFDHVSSAALCLGLNALSTLVVITVSWVLNYLGG